MAFATSGPLGKLAAPAPAIAVAALRTGIASIVLAAVDWRRFVAAIRGLTRRQRIGVVVAGALLGFHLAFFLAGLVTTSLVGSVPRLPALSPSEDQAFALMPARMAIARKTIVRPTLKNSAPSSAL